MAKPVLFYVHDSVVESYVAPGGEVNELLWKVAQATREYGRAYVLAGHTRSGRLAKSIYANRPVLDGSFKASSRTGATARHAVYFIEGTGPIIGHAPFMLVPKQRGMAHMSSASKGAGTDLYKIWKTGGKKRGRMFYRPKTVRGQMAHPFLQEGLRVALAKERLT